MKTDAEHIQHLQDMGFEVVAGTTDLAEEHGLTDIHSYTGLRHLGFGSFATEKYTFVRHDSPQGHRFYTMEG